MPLMLLAIGKLALQILVAARKLCYLLVGLRAIPFDTVRSHLPDTARNVWHGIWRHGCMLVMLFQEGSNSFW
jgi:hypothetical protein